MIHSDNHSDIQLVHRIVAGEKTALNSLMEKYQEMVYFFILRYIHDESLAYDLTQETFVKVYTKAASYNNNYRFKTWLYQIALNLCRDHSRKHAFKTFFSLSNPKQHKDVINSVTDKRSVEKDYELSSEVEILREAIVELPHKLKTALILFSLEEKNQSECADILGVSKKTVETRVYRAKKILEKNLKNNQGNT